ncbi:hypothetical protein V6N13_055612 [Hibiscus sabdariffa]
MLLQLTLLINLKFSLPETETEVQPCVGVWSDTCTSKYARRQPFILAGSLMISLSVIIIGFSADVGYILGDTTEHCSTFKGTRTRAAFVFVIGFLMLDLANNTVQVLISTNLVMLYFAYGWLLETSWDFQLVLVGVDIDGFLSWKVELVVKPVLILKQHFLWQLLTSHLCSLSVITMSENYNGKDQSLWHYSRRTDRFSVLCNKETGVSEGEWM